jgi:2-methylcitrate dehydratase PrpD
MASLTSELAGYVTSARYEDLSASELSRLKIALVDWLAVALAGCGQDAALAVREYTAAVNAPGRATVFGSTVQTAPHMAALANATAGHVLDYDDITTLGSGHPSAPVLPAVLAVAEHTAASGRALLAAMAVGFNVEMALGLAIMPAHYERGYHNTATLGRIGATAALCSLAQLPAEACRHALSIAATAASGLRGSFGSMLKSVQVGMASMDGVISVDLATRGVTGPEDLVGGRYGLLQSMSPIVRMEPLLDWLAHPSYSLIDTVWPKRFPSCLSTHGAIEAALQIRQKITALGEIAEIECGVHPLCLDNAAIPQPTSGMEAKFSVQYCIAAALGDGQVNLRSFDDQAVERPDARALANKVHLVPVEAFSKERECSLKIVLRNGDILHSHARLFAPHSLDDDWTLVTNKMKETSELHLESRQSGDTITAMINSLETLVNVRQLTALVQCKK